MYHAFGTDEMITSDVTREAEFVTEDGLITLSDESTPWVVWVDDIESSVAGSSSAGLGKSGNSSSTCHQNKC